MKNAFKTLLVMASFNGTLLHANDKEKPSPEIIKVSASLEASENNTKFVKISFETAQQSAICHLTNKDLQMSYPKESPAAKLTVGKITVNASINANTVCLTAIGPHKGSLSLNLGNSLPSLVGGYYKLDINGKSLGYLVVAKGTAKIIEESELPK